MTKRNLILSLRNKIAAMLSVLDAMLEGMPASEACKKNGISTLWLEHLLTNPIELSLPKEEGFKLLLSPEERIYIEAMQIPYTSITYIPPDVGMSVEIIMNQLDDRKQGILKDYYWNRLTMDDIAKKMGTSKQWVSNTIKRCLVVFRKADNRFLLLHGQDYIDKCKAIHDQWNAQQARIQEKNLKDLEDSLQDAVLVHDVKRLKGIQSTAQQAIDALHFRIQACTGIGSLGFSKGLHDLLAKNKIQTTGQLYLLDTDALKETGITDSNYMPELQAFIETHGIIPVPGQSIQNYDMGSIKICNIHLPVRAQNCLVKSGILTLRQLQGCTVDDLMHIDNMGRSSVLSVLSAADRHNVKLTAISRKAKKLLAEFMLGA